MLEGTSWLFSFRRKDVLHFIVVNKDTSYLLYDDIKSEFGDIFEKGNYQSLLFFFARECPKIRLPRRVSIFQKNLCYHILSHWKNVTGIRKIR